MTEHEYEPNVYKVAGGWHAASGELNLAVLGATPEEARAKFEKSVQQRLALRERLRRERELEAATS